MQRIIIWDNDGTVMGSKDPADTSSTAKVILPYVKEYMNKPGIVNVICSGMKTPDSEMRDFDPVMIIKKFEQLMTQLPIRFAVFSPARGGTQCWIVMKKKHGAYEVRAAHENPRYVYLKGTFKKPGTGMLVVIRDILCEEYGYAENDSMLFIGDSEQDEKAAHDFGIPFVWAQDIHKGEVAL
jgi:hypothetical protein